MVSSHGWQRSPNPLFYEDSPILPTPLLFKFCPTLPPPPSPHPSSLLPPIPFLTAHCVVLFLWLNGWSRHIWCAILRNDMDVHMSHHRTLICVLCNKASSFIVCIGVSTPLQKHHFHLSCQAPLPLNLQTVQVPLFRKFPLYIGFLWTSP